MQAKNYKQKGSQFFETLKNEIGRIVGRIEREGAGPEELEEALTELAISKCKESFKNGVEAGRYAKKRKSSR